MKRRLFLKSLSAVMAAPALPSVALSAGPSAPVAPKLTMAQQLWVSYFKTAKGQQALASVRSATGLNTAKAKAIVMRSMAQARTPMTVMTKAAVASHARPFKAPKMPDLQQIIHRAVPNLRDDILCNCAEFARQSERTEHEPT